MNMKDKKSSIFRVITILSIVFAVTTAMVFGYYIYNKAFGENEYCQSLRKQKNISLDYNCTLGDEYIENGKTYIYIKIERPNKNFIDYSRYTMEKESKKITDAIFTS